MEKYLSKFQKGNSQVTDTAWNAMQTRTEKKKCRKNWSKINLMVLHFSRGGVNESCCPSWISCSRVNGKLSLLCGGIQAFEKSLCRVKPNLRGGDGWLFHVRTCFHIYLSFSEIFQPGHSMIWFNHKARSPFVLTRLSPLIFLFVSENIKKDVCMRNWVTLRTIKRAMTRHMMTWKAWPLKSSRVIFNKGYAGEICALLQMGNNLIGIRLPHTKFVKYNFNDISWRIYLTDLVYISDNV